MAVDTIQVGMNGNEVAKHVTHLLNVRPPFVRPVSEIAGLLLVGTHFTSGNDVVLNIKEAIAIETADVKIGDGSDPEVFTNQDYSYTPPTSGAGAKITVSAADQNLMINIKYRV
jgi:hypothetical protein